MQLPIRTALAGLLCLAATSQAFCLERVHLANGFALDCVRREPLSEGKVRLYLDADGGSYMDVAAGSIVSSETVAPSTGTQSPGLPVAEPSAAGASAPGLQAMIAAAGKERRINVDLLNSVVQAESGGHVRAVSKAGAQGLMQLMPGTARAMGVNDSFAADQNLRGGATYLDALLVRFHDDLPLALAAYNAGPGAVDQYHGVPPYRETRAYVARIIHEFNRRTLLAARQGAGVVKPVAPNTGIAEAQPLP